MEIALVDQRAQVAGYLTIRKYRNGQLVYESEPMPNKVVSGSGGYGRNLIARALAGDGSFPLEIDSAALGDSNTSPADSDTGLGNSLVSAIPITNKTVTDDTIQVDVFIADGNLPDDEYKEFGLFCGAQLFARILISPSYTKASGEDTLFSYTLGFSG